MPITITVTAGVALIAGARWIEVHHEIQQPTPCEACTVWSPGEQGAPFFTACPDATGGNASGHLSVSFTQCGRSVIIAHDQMSALWVSVGYQLDRDGTASVESSDFFQYLSAFFSSDPSADFTGDGEVTTEDLYQYLSCFLSQQ